MSNASNTAPPADLVDLVGPAVAAEVALAYTRPQRHHHDLEHAAEVAAAAHELGGDRATLLAAWFHDAVYEPTATDNEEASARLLLELLPGDPDAPRAAALVRMTAEHDPADGDVQAAILSDADLAVLAADEARYERYRRAVRREYAFVDDETWVLGRGAVLADLLGRERLFHTAAGLDRFEAAARANLQRELDSLTG